VQEGRSAQGLSRNMRAALQRGLEGLRAGRSKPAEEVLDRLEAKYRLSFKTEQALVEDIHRSLEARAAARRSKDPAMEDFRAMVAAIVAEPDNPAHHEDRRRLAAWAQVMIPYCEARGFPLPWEREDI